MLPPLAGRSLNMPWQIPAPRGFPPRFEKRVEVEAEDNRRIRILSGFNRPRTRALADHLSASDFHEVEPITMASSRCMRVARIRIIEQGAALLEDTTSLAGLSFVTIVPPKWFVSEGELLTGGVPDFKKQLRGYLHRAGIHDTIDGLIIGHFEAAYCREPSTGQVGFAFHVHLVCNDTARDVFERMRPFRSLKRTDNVAMPLRIEPIKEEDWSLRSVLGYCFKAFWHCRSIDIHPEGLDDIRRPRGSRLPNIALCRELLWRQNRGLAETSIVVGTRDMAQAFRHTWS